MRPVFPLLVIILILSTVMLFLSAGSPTSGNDAPPDDGGSQPILQDDRDGSSPLTITPCPVLNPAGDESGNEVTLAVLRETLSLYGRTHTYYGNRVFGCGEMAVDVWDMLQTRNVTTRIAVGNLEEENQTVFGANHAWVMVETENRRWVAADPTLGLVIQYRENPRYYTGWFFPSPKEFLEFRQYTAIYNDQVARYNRAVMEYNGLLERMQSRDSLNRFFLAEELAVRDGGVEIRSRDLNETLRFIGNLTEGGCMLERHSPALGTPPSSGPLPSEPHPDLADRHHPGQCSL